MRIKQSMSSSVFDVVNIILVGVLAIVCIFPIYFVVINSFASEKELLKNGYVLLTKSFDVASYSYMLTNNSLLRAFGVSVLVSVFGTAFNLIMQFSMGYALSEKELIGRKIWMKMVLFTMIFNGGLIPTYLVVKSLHMTNSLWALVIPTAIAPFNLILCINFLKEIPPSLKESARIDGANDLCILWSIILPLSTPALATFAIFYSVGHWNNYMNALIYIQNHKLFPIQVVLRSVVMLAEGLAKNMDSSNLENIEIPTAGLKYTMIVLATLPIVLVYPFFQKYFTKGLLVGGVKG